MRQTSGQRKRMEIRAVAEAWVCVSSYRVATPNKTAHLEP